MANETKAQKELIASGFLDTNGQLKNFSRPASANPLEDVLMKYGDLFTKGFSDQLAAANKSASGYLDSNIRFEFTRFGTRYEAIFFMPYYAKFVDEGVKGINPAKSINKTSPYRFKFSNPSPNMVKSLESWLKEKNVTAIITVPKGIVKEATAARTLAYAMGRSIKQKGLEASFFKKKTVDKLKESFRREVIKAAGDDLKIKIFY